MSALVTALESDVRVIAPAAAWRPDTQLRINSGVEILKRAAWSEVAETFRRHRAAEPAAATRDPYAPSTAARPVRNPRFGSASFQAIRGLGGVYRPKEDWRPLRQPE